jgi:hypothetical protein
MSLTSIARSIVSTGSFVKPEANRDIAACGYSISETGVFVLAFPVSGLPFDSGLGVVATAPGPLFVNKSFIVARLGSRVGAS